MTMNLSWNCQSKKTSRLQYTLKMTQVLFDYLSSVWFSCFISLIKSVIVLIRQHLCLTVFKIILWSILASWITSPSPEDPGVTAFWPLPQLSGSGVPLCDLADFPFSDSSWLSLTAAPACASLQRRARPAHQTASQPDRLPLSARGPGSHSWPWQLAPPRPLIRIGKKKGEKKHHPHFLPLHRLFISCIHLQVKTESGVM